MHGFHFIDIMHLLVWIEEHLHLHWKFIYCVKLNIACPPSTYESWQDYLLSWEQELRVIDESSTSLNNDEGFHFSPPLAKPIENQWLWFYINIIFVLLLYNVRFNVIFCYSSIYNKLGSRTLDEKSRAHRESCGWWC